VRELNSCTNLSYSTCTNTDKLSYLLHHHSWYHSPF